MFSHELDGLRQLGIPVKKWGDSYRVKIRGKTGRMVWVSDISRGYNKTQIAKQYSTSFPRSASVNDRVTALKDAVSKPTSSYTTLKKRSKEVHTFQRMSQQEVFSKLNETLRAQTRAFKVSLQLGYNLIDTQTGEKRYFSPSWDTRVSDNTIVINKKADIQTKIIDAMNAEDFSALIKYPSSKWKVDEITAIQATLFYRDHRLGDSGVKIPDVIKQNHHVVDFPETNNKCVFYCIAYHLQTEGKDFRRIKTLVKDRFKQYCSFKNIEYSLPAFKSFQPIDLLQFDDLEECFGISIDVHEMNTETNEVTYIRESDSTSSNKMHILDYNGHAMYIQRIDALSSKYPCDSCDMIFGTCHKLAAHKKTQCTVLTRAIYCEKPTNYKPMQNQMKSLMGKYNVNSGDFHLDHFIVYDFESILQSTEDQRGKSTEYTSKHIPVSVSICDSLTNQAKCFISDDPKDLLTQMFDYIHVIARDIYEHNVSKFDKLLEAVEKSGNNRDHDKVSNACEQIPLLGFNSGRYDLNLIKKDLFTVLGPENIKMVIKNPSYMCIATKYLRILDISNYLPAGTSYDSYLKTYLGGCRCQNKITCVCGLGKGIFPYEYITSFDKLNEKTLPLKYKFDSKFRGTQISDEDYKRVEFVWNHYGMKSIKDLLIWYNNLDVQPFVEAVQKQRELYKRFDLDMLMDGVSLPSLAEKVMYQTLYKDLDPIKRISGDPFMFPNSRFDGYRKQDKKAGREFDMSMSHLNEQLAKQHHSCRHCGRALTVGNVSADRINNTKGHVDGNIVMSCIPCNCARKDMSIGGFGYMKRIEANTDKLVWSIDADNKDIYQKMKDNIAGGPSIIFNRYAKRNETTIRNGEKLVKKIIGYDANALYLWALGGNMPCGKLSSLQPYDNMMNEIKADKLFGFLECDIETPDSLKEYFSEMTPIFKNTEIDPTNRSLIGEHMHDYNMSRDHKNTMKSRKLIGSYFGKKILIYTPLLKWYLKHGLVITKTYSFIKAASHRPFKNFMDEVSNARRGGDVDKDQAMIAEMMKLIGNSAFGRSGMDKSKHKDTKYKSCEESISSIVEQNRFYDVEELGDSYEITLKKRTMKLNNPIHLSIAIYQLAKLRMLQFYYDCVDYYFDRSDFQYQEMDTDSAYIAFSDDKPFENLIRPELAEHYKAHKYDWFPRDFNEEVAGFDRRTPGLFKEEWRGNAMVCLSSKNYICYMGDENHKQKVSAKGVQQGGNRNGGILNPDGFENVVQNRITLNATNKGFRVDKRSQSIITYEQKKVGLSYYYDKRRVQSDGISTEPLDL